MKEYLNIWIHIQNHGEPIVISGFISRDHMHNNDEVAWHTHEDTDLGEI